MKVSQANTQAKPNIQNSDNSPTWQDLLELEKSTSLKPLKRDVDLASIEFQTEMYERQKIISMRSEWSNLFKAVIIVILVAEILLTILVGTGKLVFKDEWFLRIIVLGGFTQIIGMPIIVTRFLFSRDNLLYVNGKEGK